MVQMDLFCLPPTWRGRFVGHVIITVLVISILCVTQCDAEYFSSADRMLAVADMEVDMVNIYRQFVQMQQEELNAYRKSPRRVARLSGLLEFMEYVKEQHRLAEENLEDYLGNPINAFQLIKRLASDWPELQLLLQQSTLKQELNETVNKVGWQNLQPREDDLRGAAKGIARIQNFYGLDTNDLAEGEIDGIGYDTPLRWDDCYELAILMSEDKEWALAKSWFEMALEFIEDVADPHLQQKYKIDIYEYLALANYELGNVDEAVSYLDELLHHQPNHLARDVRLLMRSSLDKPIPKPQPNFNWWQNYTRLCRGELLPEPIHNSLECRLESHAHPFLLLAPFKIEELSRDPQIIIFHDMLNDEQIDQIYQKSLDGMERSGVVFGEGSKIDDVRVSQQTWLEYTEPALIMARRLVGWATGLDPTNSETMQVANYGIGGHYEAHHDFLNKEVFDGFSGDRMATCMFYLSNVEQGGYTVFPHLNVCSPPVRGSLIVWYNLHRSLASDYRTLHGGCPVIKGSKSIANIWIHAGKQEFHRPCDYFDDRSKSAAFVP